MPMPCSMLRICVFIKFNIKHDEIKAYFPFKKIALALKVFD